MEPNALDIQVDRWRRQPSSRLSHEITTALSDDVDRAIRAAGSEPGPLTRAEGKMLIVGALNNYQPTKGATFRTWANQHLAQLPRQLRASRFATRVPEMRARESVRLQDTIRQIEAETGFEPPDAVLADRLGMSLKRIANLRKYGRTEQLDDEQNTPEPQDRELIHAMVYYSLPPRDQFIFERMTGFNGVRALPAHEIARRLKVTPAAVSQRMARIQTFLQQAEEAAP